MEKITNYFFITFWDGRFFWLVTCTYGNLGVAGINSRKPPGAVSWFLWLVSCAYGNNGVAGRNSRKSPGSVSWFLWLVSCTYGNLGEAGINSRKSPGNGSWFLWLVSCAYWNLGVDGINSRRLWKLRTTQSSSIYLLLIPIEWLLEPTAVSGRKFGEAPEFLEEFLEEFWLLILW